MLTVSDSIKSGISVVAITFALFQLLLLSISISVGAEMAMENHQNSSSSSEPSGAKCVNSSDNPLPESFQSLENCKVFFDIDRDGALNISEFTSLCKNLFRNDEDLENSFYSVEESQIKLLFDIFDTDGNGLIDSEEFDVCWSSWIEKILCPVSALIIIDVQNDFIGGSLSIANSSEYTADDIIQPLNNLLENVAFNAVFYAKDWHPENHISFIDNVALRKLDASSKIQNPEDVKVFDTVVFEGPPLMEQKLWPAHCVQNSEGSHLHKNLKIAEQHTIIYKGTNPDVDSYSAFFDNHKLSKTNLDEELKANGITDVYLGGLAYEICVGKSAQHANELGYRTVVVDDAARGFSTEDVENFQKSFKEKSGLIVSSDKVEAMVHGRDRRPELAIKLALDIQNQKTKEISE